MKAYFITISPLEKFVVGENKLNEFMSAYDEAEKQSIKVQEVDLNHQWLEV